jgi:two-component system, OmpR family, sensor histidine kinase SenX3
VLIAAIAAISTVAAALLWLIVMSRSRPLTTEPAGTPDVAPVADPAPPPPTSPAPSSPASAPRWNDVADRLTLGVVVAGASGRVHYRNPASDAFAGTYAGLLVDDTVEHLLVRALEGHEERQNLELYGPPRVAVVVTASPLPGGGAMVTIEDVSERRRVDAVRTDFVANISHELKTPVGALAVLAETLADSSDEDVDAEVVRRIAGRMVDESHRVARTIDDLMELSRIELGEEPIRDLVDVLDVVDGAIERVRPLAELHRIDVATLEVPVNVRVSGDRRQLVSALGNLVENAVKYSEPGSAVQVRVRVEGTFAELMVADNGIGIPATDHDRIFERFYRVDKARSRDTGGTGLGLSIVRHVATNHGGEVLVSSQEGEGSTFVLRIPTATMPERSDDVRGTVST